MCSIVRHFDIHLHTHTSHILYNLCEVRGATTWNTSIKWRENRKRIRNTNAFIWVTLRNETHIEIHIKFMSWRLVFALLFPRVRYGCMSAQTEFYSFVIWTLMSLELNGKSFTSRPSTRVRPSGRKGSPFEFMWPNKTLSNYIYRIHVHVTHMHWMFTILCDPFVHPSKVCGYFVVHLIMVMVLNA